MRQLLQQALPCLTQFVGGEFVGDDGRTVTAILTVSWSLQPLFALQWLRDTAPSSCMTARQRRLCQKLSSVSSSLVKHPCLCCNPALPGVCSASRQRVQYTQLHAT